jgi:hypothetical protein
MTLVTLKSKNPALTYAEMEADATFAGGLTYAEMDGNWLAAAHRPAQLLQVAAFPAPGDYIFGCATGPDGAIFVGRNTTASWLFSRKTGLFRAGPQLPKTVQFCGARGVLLDGRVYFMAAIAWPPPNYVAVLIYDVEQNAWSEGATSPALCAGEVNGNAVALTAGEHAGRIAVFSSFASRLHAYDPNLDSWFDIAAAPYLGYWPGACMLGNASVLFWGGSVAPVAHVFDQEQLTFTQVANLPGSVWQHSAIAGPDGMAWHVGGYGFGEGVMRYNWANDLWENYGAQLKIGRSGSAAYVMWSDGVLLLAGGAGGDARCEVWSLQMGF